MAVEFCYDYGASRMAAVKAAREKLAARRKAKWEAMKAAMIRKRTPGGARDGE